MRRRDPVRWSDDPAQMLGESDFSRRADWARCAKTGTLQVW
jgi:hypothetical protein